MKIVFYNLTTTTKTGGIETFNWEMAKALKKRGHEVHLFGGKGDVIENRKAHLKIFLFPYLKRDKIPFLGSRLKKFIERVTFGFYAIKSLIKNKYDYIYLSKPYDIPVALIASKFSKSKIIYGSGGTEFFPGYKYLVKKLDYFFACSNFNANQIEKYCGIRPKVLYNGINTDLFKPLQTDILLKRDLSIREDEKIVITVSRLIGLKGIQYAIQAVDKIVKSGYKIKYLIIGEGEYGTKLKKIVKELKADSYIKFLGQKHNYELPKYYSISDIAIFPTIADEAFGISIAEAMACGVPVISTDVGGIPEVTNNYGILVQPKSVNALVKAMEMLLKDSNKRKYISMQARDWIEKQFSWDKIAEKLEKYIL